MIAWRWLLALLLPTLACALVACGRDPSPVAKLQHKAGRVENDRAASVGRFSSADVGLPLFIGDGVRTGEKARAKLILAGGAELALEERTLIRFVARGGGGAIQRAELSLEVGEASLSSEGADVRVETAFGDAILRPRSRVLLSRAEGAVRFEVAIGSAIFEAQDGRRSLSAGERLEVEMGAAQLETRPSSSGSASAGNAPSAAPSVAAPTTPERFETGQLRLEPSSERRVIALPGGSITIEPGALATLTSGARGTSIDVPEGTVTVQGKSRSRVLKTGEAAILHRAGELRDTRIQGLSHVDLNATPGDSFVVHDPRPPSAIAFAAPPGCASSRVAVRVEPASTAFVGRNTVSVPFGAGRHRYVVGCIGEQGQMVEAARGTVTVLADAGSRRLPTSAPDTQVDADGRAYTVLYQNRLPRIIVNWPKAPPAASYALTVVSGGKSQTLSLGEPRHVFHGGSLAEGAHRIVFEGGGSRSRATSIDIEFDNATPTASISSPANGSFAPGAIVSVAGSALPGWTVAVGETVLLQDGQNRFSGHAETRPSLPLSPAASA